MNSMTFEQFAHGCEEQSVGLHRDILRDGMKGRGAMRYTWTPNGMFAAITRAGRLLKRHEQIDLSEQPIVGVEPDESDVCAKALVGIVNGCYYRNHPSENYEANQPSGRPEIRFEQFYRLGIGVCNSTERFFYSTITNVLSGRTNGDAVTRVFHSAGRPIFLQKGIYYRSGFGNPSALSFVPVEIDGIPFPPGSYFSIRLGGTGTAGNDAPRPKVALTELVPVSDIEQVGFLRMGPYAIEPDERGLFGRPHLSQTEQMFSRLPLPDLAAKIAAALGLGSSSQFTEEHRQVA